MYMKLYLKLLLPLLVILCHSYVQSQTLNWGNLKKNERHILGLKAGLEYSTVVGVNYGYQLNTKRPLVLQADFSLPLGETLLDDLKSKIGASWDVFQVNDFHFIVGVHGVFRRYESEFVRLLNFGSDMSADIGYYRSRWFVAGEVGFDKAIVTHFKHSEAYKKIYPGVKDGWYEPPTGGNFYYGIQAGYSFDRTDISLSAGKITNQDFKTEPMAPFYASVGVHFKFRPQTTDHRRQ
jgi:hypothetical protein